MYKRILVPLDGSATAEQALSYAQLVARPLLAKIELLRVFGPPPSELSDPIRGIYLDQVSDSFRNLAEDYLNEKAVDLKEAGFSVSSTVYEGDPAPFIVTEAAKVSETLIVMSTHGRSGITRWVMGSVTDKVLQATNDPMLIVRSKEAEPAAQELELKDIIVPLDGSPLAEQVLPHAIALSKGLRAGITLLRAITPSAEYFLDMDYLPVNYDSLNQELEESAKQYLEKMKVQVSQLGVSKVQTVLVHGNAAGAINDYARGIPNNAIAMTSHGRSGVGRWVLGSVADRVIRHSEDPVLLVRAF